MTDDDGGTVGPSVDQLADAFEDIDREKLQTIRDSHGTLTFRTAADVLEAAAEQGKVPEKDYHALASRASSAEETLDLSTEDPLDDVPDADPRSSHNEQRGRTARQHLKATNYEAEAKRAIKTGSIRDEIELLTTIDKWANEALLDPNTASLPESAKKPTQLLGNDLLAAVDDVAAGGEVESLKEIESLATQLNASDFADSLAAKARRRQEMLQSDGTEIDEGRERIFDADHSLAERRRLQREAVAAQIPQIEAVRVGLRDRGREPIAPVGVYAHG